MSWTARLGPLLAVDVARELGLEVRENPSGWSIGPCPACDADRRHPSRKDRRGAIGVGSKHPEGWRCHECDASGDAIDLVAYVLEGRRCRELAGDRKDRVREWCERFAGVDGGRRYRPTTKEPPRYPAADELAQLWEICGPVVDDVEAAAWLTARGIDPELVAARDLARALPIGAGAVAPAWAAFERESGPARSWDEAGFRLIVPLYDAAGVMRSVIARRITEGKGIKGVSPTGCKRSELVMADAMGRYALEHGRAHAELGDRPVLVVAEGEADFLCWATEPYRGARFGTWGIVSGSWSKGIAARVPSGAALVIATDHDEPNPKTGKRQGEEYCAAIVASLEARAAELELERWQLPIGAPKGAEDAGDVRAAGLPLEPRGEPIGGSPAIRGAPQPGTTYTDLGNAERFAQQHGEDLRYCQVLGGWFVWTGSHWARDETRDAERRAHLTARRLYSEVEDLARELRSIVGDDEAAKRAKARLDAAIVHAKRTENASRLAAMLGEARSILPIPVAQSTFDAESTALLLNTPDGTIDLRTGEVREHARGDLITKVTGARYDPTATAPRFEKFLETILPDPEVRAFMRRWAGYCATGVIREHILPVWYGTGANGKGTLAELLKGVMGDYALGCPDGFFEEQKHQKHQTEIARLRGARLAIASETNHACNLAESKVKKLTGGDTLTANFMHQNHFDFRPTAKFVLFTNHKPRIKSTDNGIRRRIVLIPFEVTIPSDKQDLSLLETLLREEGPGILRWIVEGARELNELDGRLNPPASIRAATEEYLASEDVVGRFLSEACTVKPGDRFIKTKAGHLFATFRAWCEETGESTCDQRDFAGRLQARGFQATKSNGTRWYFGISPDLGKEPQHRERTAPAHNEFFDA